MGYFFGLVAVCIVAAVIGIKGPIGAVVVVLLYLVAISRPNN